MLWVGVDIGGTFTDLVVYDDARGDLKTAKCASVPDDPANAVFNAVSSIGLDLAAVARFRHGATVATNTVLERKGARLGVLTTAGFRDVLIVGRGNRVQLYDIKATRPAGLVARSQVLEVAERVDANGNVLTALDETAVADAAAHFLDMGVEAIAVCFLHAYANPEPERRAVAILGERLPDIPVSCSSAVLPEHREYERFATTALNAYVAPRMSRYLEGLQQGLTNRGLSVTPEIMTSSGGSWPLERMARLPVNSMLSGPAGGVIGAAHVAAELGYENIITYDMGGTSTDTCLVRGGRFSLASEGQIGGLPNRAPQIEINTVGAGGGSIAYIDVGGFLNVGPRSAGAVPGPACYGRGGREPTVTDANVVLGRLQPADPLGGEIEIDIAAAEQAIDRLAKDLGLDRQSTAEGVIRLAVIRMTATVKEISVMRGLDPRDFALFAYGGAGPLHAALMAEELGIERIVVPAMSGTFSAHGLLLADHRRDYSQTRVTTLTDATSETLNAIIEPLREAARDELSAEGFAISDIRCETSLDMRYEGQAFELTTPVPDTIDNIDAVLDAFSYVYEERYAQADDGPVEVVTFRVAAYGSSDKPKLVAEVPAGSTKDAEIGKRMIGIAGEQLQTPVYQRERLPQEARVDGPAIIEEDGATTLIPPNFWAERLHNGTLAITRVARS